MDKTEDFSSNRIIVSIVVPVYNAKDTIESCIDSLLNLNYPNEDYEVIAVDNNSNDSTYSILQNYNNLISIYKESIKGPSAARNKGISEARGKYIAFTDSDCVVDKDWLGNIIKPLDDPKVGIAGGSTTLLDGANHIEGFCEKIHNHSKSLTRKRPRAVSLNWASRKEVLEQAGLFDNSFIRAQDTELSFRIHLAGYKFVYQPDAVIYHKEASTYSGLFNKGYLSGLYGIKFYKKHFSALKSLGHKRINLSVYPKIFTNIINIIRNKDPEHSKCFVVFQLGRFLGKLVGCFKFKHISV